MKEVRIKRLSIVVICFHFCIFVVLATTFHALGLTDFLLWFAFIFVSLSYWQQPAGGRLFFGICCDFLSFLSLCPAGYTVSPRPPPPPTLWFAFIFVSLSYWQQHKTQELKDKKGCDLLSFLYLCRTGNNDHCSDSSADFVVICFHFCIFVVLATTSRKISLKGKVLWFAFIFVSLSYWQQHQYQRQYRQ